MLCMLLRELIPFFAVFAVSAVVVCGAARARGRVYIGETGRVHQQTQRVQVLVEGQDKEAECF